MRGTLVFGHLVIRVAPEPAFAGLGGADDGVLRGVEVPSGVLVFGGVAAADVAALLARAQVHLALAQDHLLGADALIRSLMR